MSTGQQEERQCCKRDVIQWRTSSYQLHKTDTALNQKPDIRMVCDKGTLSSHLTDGVVDLPTVVDLFHYQFEISSYNMQTYICFHTFRINMLKTHSPKK